MNVTAAAEIVSDWLPLDIVDVDGRALIFHWAYLAGVDTLTVTTGGCRLAVIEGLDSPRPCVRPGRAWTAWCGSAQRSDRLIAHAKRQWAHRNELVTHSAADDDQSPEPQLVTGVAQPRVDAPIA